eukprot:526197-Amphidinium_carterae.2
MTYITVLAAPQIYSAPALSHSHVQKTAPTAPNPQIQQVGANPLSCGTGGLIEDLRNPLDSLRGVAPGSTQKLRVLILWPGIRDGPPHSITNARTMLARYALTTL